MESICFRHFFLQVFKPDHHFISVLIKITCVACFLPGQIKHKFVRTKGKKKKTNKHFYSFQENYFDFFCINNNYGK